MRIAEHCPEDISARNQLLDLARRHADASLPVVSGSDYMVEHWLAAYALILLST